MTGYDAMTDEQLAVLVAERVMGWEYMRDISAWITYDAHTDPLITHANAGATRPWSPATSWSDAGRVLEKMRADGWWIQATLANDVFCEMSRRKQGADARADTAPRAICIAALRAVEARA